MIRFARPKPALVQRRARLGKPGAPRAAIGPSLVPEAKAHAPEETEQPEAPTPPEPVPDSALSAELEPDSAHSAELQPLLAGSELATALPAEIIDEEPESRPPDSFGSEEERFFSEPHAADPEATPSADAPRMSGTLAPTVMDAASAFGAVADDEAAFTATESPLLQARQKRLRHAVVAALGVSIALLLVGISHRRGDNLQTKSSAASASVARLSPPQLNPNAPQGTAPEPAAAPEPLASSAALTPENGAPASASIAGSESARALIQAARSLLEAGKIREGVAAARRALAANSRDAEPYILLAAGLQDLGDWAGAQAVFAACKDRTHSGPNADCRYFLNRTH